MNFFDNITFRRKRSNSDCNKTNVSEVSSEILDGTTSSLPDISNDETELSKQLQERIEMLELELKSAHQEIEILLLENKDLKYSNEELLKKNELYKKVTQSPSKPRTTTPKKKPPTISYNKQTQSEPAHMNDQTTINRSTQHTQTELRLIPEDKQIQQTFEFTQGNLKNTLERTEPQNVNDKRVCILSTDKKSKILSVAENNVPANKKYQICHYLTPNVDSKQMLKGLGSKISHLTKNDYCLIIIGEEDFLAPRDHFSIARHIQERLLKEEHTNIIICLPKLKHCNSINHDMNMYNWSINNFNNILCLELQSLKHVFIFNPNKNVKYNSCMIYKISGTLNYKGMRAIIQGMYKLIEDTETQYIHNSNQIYTQEGKETNTQFFR